LKTLISARLTPINSKINGVKSSKNLKSCNQASLVRGKKPPVILEANKKACKPRRIKVLNKMKALQMSRKVFKSRRTHRRCSMWPRKS